MATQDLPEDISPSFDDTTDFANADRGFIASFKPCHIKNARGQTVWNNDEYNFITERQQQQQCPDTVNPKLWRQAQLQSKQGLYRITDSIYQVRGFDISHVTFVEGKTGIIVIDPLISGGGVRPVKAIIYSHSHTDHYGGAAGVLPSSSSPGNDTAAAAAAASVDTGTPIIAPEGFIEEATSENVFAGPIMRYRAAHMYGSFLPRSPVGQVGVGLGMGTSRGTTSLIPPTVDIKQTGQTLTIDGVRIVFQMVPNTEAPAEMNMYFPDERALLVAECATHALHNIITLRGALVRDAKAWSKYLDETIVLFCEGGETDVLFASHGWPTWGREEAKIFLEEQRDLYGYLHDQTVKMMNEGWTGTEIAERFVLPPRLRRAWHAQGFYGSVSHNVKGIYQRYMTWFDGFAENLCKWPPHEEGCRYVKCMGGAEEVLNKAKAFIEEGDLRFAATLLGHLVAAADKAVGGKVESRIKGREMLASVFQRLGFETENATWRNFYLTQAAELRVGGKKLRGRNSLGPPVFPPRLSVEQWLGVLSISIDGERAGRESQEKMQIEILVSDLSERWCLILSNGALTYRRRGDDQQQPTSQGVKKGPFVSLRLNKAELHQILSGKGKGSQSTQVLRGDVQVFNKVLAFAGIDGARSKF